MRKLQEDDEPQSVPFLVYLKAFFLVGAIVFGMFFLSRAAEREKLAEQKSKGISVPSSIDLSDAKKSLQEQIDHEIRTNDKYNTAVELIENQRERVLGEATKATDTLVENSKQTFMDYMYEHTVGFVVEKMIEQMPEEQKDKLIEKVDEN